MTATVPDLKAIIVDDEVGNRRSLRSLISKYCQGVNILGEADGVESALSFVKQSHPDLVFLDIRMRDGTGFDFLQAVENKDFQVIFTTAYDEYAIKAFRFSAVDYLLKPINLEELKEAISKAREIQQRSKGITRAPILDNLLRFNIDDPSITITTDKSIEFVKISDIIRLEADASYTQIFLRSSEKIVSSKNLKVFEDILKEYRFFRTHHSHLINLSAVKRYIRTDGGSIELKNGEQVPLSRRRKDLFFEVSLKR